MLIVNVTTYVFNPVTEYDLIKNFEECNKNGWIKSESTQGISYTHTERRIVNVNGKGEG